MSAGSSRQVLKSPVYGWEIDYAGGHEADTSSSNAFSCARSLTSSFSSFWMSSLISLTALELGSDWLCNFRSRAVRMSIWLSFCLISCLRNLIPSRIVAHTRSIPLLVAIARSSYCCRYRRNGYILLLDERGVHRGLSAAAGSHRCQDSASNPS